jgi:ADP-heptose:LPS heptosyltransferase
MQRLKNAIYAAVSRASKVGRSATQPRTLLIIKTDEIGDYVLWRNVLPCIRKSSAFKDHKVTLLGNPAWKELATAFDSSYVDEFIWLDKKKFKSNMGYRFQFLRSIKNRGFEKLVNAIYSRSPRVDDAIVAVCTSAHKTGMQRNDHNVASFEKDYDRDLYDKIHQLPLTGLFEFERNVLFTSLFLNQPCSPEFGFNNAHLPSSPVDLQNYAVVFPGSGRKDRRWAAANFARVASHLHEVEDVQVVLAGGPGDVDACKEVASLLDFDVTNIAGTTSLLSFIGLLSKARFLVSVDTGSVHLAAAAGCMVFGLFNGSQYGRFAPYPGNILQKPFYTIYPPEFEKELSSLTDLFEKYQYFSPFSFNQISPERVISLLDKSY